MIGAEYESKAWPPGYHAVSRSSESNEKQDGTAGTSSSSDGRLMVRVAPGYIRAYSHGRVHHSTSRPVRPSSAKSTLRATLRNAIQATSPATGSKKTSRIKSVDICSRSAFSAFSAAQL